LKKLHRLAAQGDTDGIHFRAARRIVSTASADLRHTVSVDDDPGDRVHPDHVALWSGWQTTRSRTSPPWARISISPFLTTRRATTSTSASSNIPTTHPWPRRAGRHPQYAARGRSSAVILATIFGVFAGVLRLSNNWIVSRLMGVYVERLPEHPDAFVDPHRFRDHDRGNAVPA
jgi:hypothetical protein